MEELKEELNVQDIMTKELLEQDDQGNELVEVMTYFNNHGVPLTNDQAKAIFLLNEYDLPDLSNYILNVRKHMTPIKRVFQLIEKLTLADRIKGNAKLSKILGQQQQVPQDVTQSQRRNEMS
jgi:hypothetical protein